MKLIPLTQGQFAKVDDEDYEYLMSGKFKWHAIYSPRIESFYARANIKIEGKWTKRLMHRIVMDAPSDRMVDHIWHNTLDNRKENLRICTNQQNTCNAKISKNNRSGYKGVYWHNQSGGYRSCITINRKKIYLGKFKCPKEAHKVYCEASKKYHGEFGCEG